MASIVIAPAARVRYELKSPTKLLRGLALVAAVIAISTAGFSAATAVSSAPQLEKVVITQGDSLWLLADRFASGQDPEAWILELVNLNQLSSSALIPGQTLLLPAD